MQRHVRSADVNAATVTNRLPRAVLLVMALFVLALLAALSVAPSAAAAEPCAKKVVADWYDNGRVDAIYPLQCYRDAIRSLPVDVRDYSSAKEDIQRALAFAQRGKDDPGDTQDGTSTGTTPTDTTPTDTSPTATTPTETTPGPVDTTPTETTGDDDGTTSAAGDRVDTSGPSSVPVPLVVLGGLALLLLAAGSIGYLSRRLQGRGDGDPPATA